MKHIFYSFLSILLLLMAVSSSVFSQAKAMKKWKNGSNTVNIGSQLAVSAGQKLLFAGDKGNFVNFELTGMAKTAPGATAALLFHTDGHINRGYEVLFHNGAIDGTRKTGSLSTVRNLYRSLAADGEWFPFYIAVRGKNISVKIKDIDVVCYTEPARPYRTDKYKKRLLDSGNFELVGYVGQMNFKDLTVKRLPVDAVNPNDTMPPVDEQKDDIIRLQQANFPVIDYHVHIKGGLTEQMAHAMSMNYGINYGVGPNAYGPMKPGEGGFGTMYMNDQDLGEYYEGIKDKPFLRGVQGEGRKWSYSFSKELLLKFDYLYTDAMTIIDHKGRTTRTYRPAEVYLDIPKEAYMDMLVDQMVKILSNEPADIFANAFYIPDTLSVEYNKYWTDERINRVLDVMKKNDIALEISARYHVPSIYIIKCAKAKGLKFTFGTNNADPNFGRLEYCIQAVKECGITADDLWFPTMSTRRERMDKQGFK
ncbi:MAG: family 16 glycoside hydrolase [Parabacteroides sp.]